MEHAEKSLVVGKLITSKESIHPYVTTRQVAERFFNIQNLDALALVEENMPVGIVTRTKLLFKLFRRYGFELYERKPIITISDKNPLIVKEDESLDTAIDKALKRSPEDIYDEIIVTDDSGFYKGLLSVKQMIIQQSNVLANSIIQREMANAKAKEFEELNKIKSQFIANVTHELRSPVNVIIGLAELMRVSAERGYVEQLKDRISLLMSTAINLRAIVTNILDLSKIEAGKMEVIYEHFDIVTLIREVADTIKVLLGNKPVDVILNLPENSLIINSDPVKVRQIITNIASNAAKFTEKGKITITLEANNNNAIVSISDTGIGIKDEDIEKLFVAFTQLEDSKTKRHEGTGLGLTITKNLLNLIGGNISVSSKFGEGTTFKITVPSKNE